MVLNKIPSFGEVKNWVNANTATSVNGETGDVTVKSTPVPAPQNQIYDSNISSTVLGYEGNISNSNSTTWEQVGTIDVELVGGEMGFRLQISWDHSAGGSGYLGHIRFTNDTLPNFQFTEGDSTTDYALPQDLGGATGTFTYTIEVYNNDSFNDTTTDWVEILRGVGPADV